jgi:hypothetical protein
VGLWGIRVDILGGDLLKTTAIWTILHGQPI